MSGAPGPVPVALGVGGVVGKVTEGAAAWGWGDGVLCNIASLAVGELALPSAAR